MTDGEKIVAYSNGIEAYYNYLLAVLNESRANPKLIEDKENIVYAKLSLIALFFVLEKEEMVEKIDNDFFPKIIEKDLIKAVLYIAKKDGNVYRIGDYEEENPANIIALIRNKFAHGDYDIDAENRLVIIKTDGKTLNLNIDDLCKLVHDSINNLYLSPKTSKFKKLLPIHRKFDKLGITKMKKKEDIIKVLKTTPFYEFTFYSLDGKDIPADLLTCFQVMVFAFENENSEESMMEQYRKNYMKIGYVFDYKRRKLKDNEIDEIIKIVEAYNIYDFELKEQKYILYTNSMKRIDPDYLGGELLIGLSNNIDTLVSMDETGKFGIDDVWAGNLLEQYNNIDETLVTSLAAHFTATYIYILEKFCLGKTKYSLDRSDQLDFAELDLSDLKPTKLTIYDTPLKQIELEYYAKMKEILSLKEKLDKAKESLNIVKSKNNTNAISVLETNIERFNDMLIDLCNEFVGLEKKYKAIKEDYAVNRKYFENRAIIEGIRNAIAHGNVHIKKFNGAKNLNDRVITFKDIYEGEVVFELETTISDFETLFLNYNIKPLLDIFNRTEDSNRYYTCDPHDFLGRRIIF